MMAASLAQELINEILSHLSDNSAALCICSVVAKSWVAPSQQHIFSCISLPSVRVADKLGRVFRDAPWIAGYVREVQIQHNEDDPVAIHDAIGVCLPRLLTLRLHTNVTFINTTSAAVGLQHFSAVQTVDLVHANFLDLEQLQRMLSQFPTLNTLLFSYRTEWSPALFASLVQNPCGLQVRHLGLFGLMRTDVLLQLCTWMGGGRPAIPPSVEVLEMNVGALDLVSLDACAPNLHELHIRQFGTTWRGLSRELAEMPRLTTVVVNAFDRHAHRSSVENIFRHLRAVAPTLSHIRITAAVLMYPGAPASTIRWDRLFVFILDTGSYPQSLQTITITMPKSKKQDVTLSKALDIAENEAKHSKEYDAATAGHVRLMLHAYDGQGNEVTRHLRGPR